MSPNESKNIEKHDASKRKFIKIAAKVAYIAPVVMSLPANAGYRRCGSNESSYFSKSYDGDGEHHHHH